MPHRDPVDKSFARHALPGLVVKRFFLGAGILFLAASSSPAPDLKLPKLPDFLKRGGGDELEETTRAPSGPGGMCMTPSGEYIVSCHQFLNHPFRVMKRDKKNNWSPFPNEEMNTPGSGASVELDAVLGLACDSKGVVWMLDNGRRTGVLPKLVAWDTKKDQLSRVIVIDKTALSPHSFLKNVVLDPVAPYVYISDPADGLTSAIIVVDIDTGVTRRVLEGHNSVQMDPGISLEVEGGPVEVRRPDGRLATPLAGVSPIAIDRKGDWLYYGPRDGASLFKIKTDLLRRSDIAPHTLISQVIGVSPKPVCESMVIDSKGRIYFGDISRGAVDYVTPDEDYLNLRLLMRDPRIAWPGGLVIGPNGHLHFFSSQLHRTPFFNGGKDVTAPPFSIFKARPLPSSRFGF